MRKVVGVKARQHASTRRVVAVQRAQAQQLLARTAAAAGSYTAACGPGNATVPSAAACSRKRQKMAAYRQVKAGGGTQARKVGIVGARGRQVTAQRMRRTSRA